MDWLSSEISLNSAPDGIHKQPGICKTFFEESFEFNPSQRNHYLALKLVLVLMKTDHIMKEQSCKQGIIKANGITSSKIILILLIEVVAFYLRFSIIEIREFSLQMSFLMTF